MLLKGCKEVYQLYGGIHNYMEAFPEGGGLFRGKNFVYDPRIALGPTEEVIGQCLVCSTRWECRVLVLVCTTCLNQSGADNSAVSEISNLRHRDIERLMCERCASDKVSVET
jgi:predicted sulfurtransferase